MISKFKKEFYVAEVDFSTILYPAHEHTFHKGCKQ